LDIGSSRSRFVFAATLMETELPLRHFCHLVDSPTLSRQKMRCSSADRNH
jgi:hypothetical protein